MLPSLLKSLDLFHQPRDLDPGQLKASRQANRGASLPEPRLSIRVEISKCLKARVDM